MKIEIAEHGRMTESGRSLLRLIQNQEMPLLDLLVRETVQNSLDAVNPEKPFVNVDFSVRQFNSKKLNKHFEQAADKLNQLFPSSVRKYDSLVITDSNTVGLTGPVQYKDVKNQNFGNCLKLIYEICKPQTEEGTGGSWGLGKTIYFRLGIGLVIYYSRIYQNGRYKSRMAACLVEDETKTETIIPADKGVRRGIAWWGKGIKKNNTVPIENSEEISKVLAVFGLTPYSEKETGTQIIIPYINSEKLLKEVYADNEKTEYKPYWTNNLVDYLRVSLQRWYAPRILNASYRGAYLNPSVNGKKIKISNMQPLFRVIREMYIFNDTSKYPNDSILKKARSQCKIESVRTRDILADSSSAGSFIYVKLAERDLLMTAPDNYKSPFQQISNRYIEMKNGNNPIVMFTRKPGMIVGYDYDGVWTHRMPRAGTSDYIIGLFVPDSQNHIKNISDENGGFLTLEEYIRRGEKADHSSWADQNIGGVNPRLIARIQNSIIKIVSREFAEEPMQFTERKNIGLSHALANILLPETGFGKKPRSTNAPTSPARPSVHKDKSFVSVVSAPAYNKNSISLEIEMYLKKGKSELILAVATDFKNYYKAEWEKEMDINFPFSIQEIRITEKKSIQKKARWNSHNITVQPLKPFRHDDLVMDCDTLSADNACGRIIIDCYEPCYLKGTLSFKSTDTSLKGIVQLRERTNE